MKNLFFMIAALSLLCSCSVNHKRKIYYLGTLENVKFVISKEDSIEIDHSKIEMTKSYFCGDAVHHAEFLGGIDTFRQIIYNKFKIPKNAKTGENLIRIIIIDKFNNLEKAEIVHYTDKETKKIIENIFRSGELNRWHSANIFLTPIKEQFEISIFIELKK